MRKKTPHSEVRLDFDVIAFCHAYLAELTDLWIEAWSATLPSIDFEKRRVWFADHIVALNDRGTSIACAFNRGNGQMAGFVTLEVKSGHIDQLAVAPVYWRSGAARVLIEDAKRRAPGRLHLDVNQDNLRAVRFYEREGFRRWSEGVNPNSGLKTWHYEWQV